jgi:hypothetical protein
MKLLRQVSAERLEDLAYSDEYAEYVMQNGDPEDFVICNGNSLLEAMETGYLFKEFLASRGIDSVAREEEVYSPYYGA